MGGARRQGYTTTRRGCLSQPDRQVKKLHLNNELEFVGNRMGISVGFLFSLKIPPLREDPQVRRRVQRLSGNHWTNVRRGCDDIVVPFLSHT